MTFDKAGATEQAIAEFNGHTVDGIQLKVSLARRQPVIDPINDASSSATWSTIAASHSQKGSHKDKRDLVAYEEDIFWASFLLASFILSNCYSIHVEYAY